MKDVFLSIAIGQKTHSLNDQFRLNKNVKGGFIGSGIPIEISKRLWYNRNSHPVSYHQLYRKAPAHFPKRTRDLKNSYFFFFEIIKIVSSFEILTFLGKCAGIGPKNF